MVAVAAILAPWAVNWSAEIYGFRGTLILISAVSLQSFVACALMQPVEWHLKKVYVTPGTFSFVETLSDKFDFNLNFVKTNHNQNTIDFKIKANETSIIGN